MKNQLSLEYFLLFLATLSLISMILPLVKEGERRMREIAENRSFLLEVIKEKVEMVNETGMKEKVILPVRIEKVILEEIADVEGEEKGRILIIEKREKNVVIEIRS